jgi:predicted aconitase with swiveling domain
MRRNGLVVIAVCVAGSLTLASLATAETVKPAAPVSGVVAAQTVTLTATVVEIDHKTRTVTLKAADGRTETIVVGEAAKNLDQVQKGDVVVVTYAEALAYEVKKGGTTSSTTVAAAAKPGETPAGVIARETKVTVTITAIDEKAPTITFKGPTGNTRTIKVKHPEKLKTVKVGDQVELTYTEALALTIEKAKK